jgi:hypothetical protein
MSRYQPLANFLAERKSDEWIATLAEIEERLGSTLPNSAYKHAAWWANQSGPGHSQTHGWRSVGWKTAGVDLAAKRVRFTREADAVEADKMVSTEDDESALLARAREMTGIHDRKILMREALKALVAREAGIRLAALGGTMPDLTLPPRERPGR